VGNDFWASELIGDPLDRAAADQGGPDVITRELVPVPIPEGRLDIYSGVARRSGVVWTTLWRDDAKKLDVAVLLVHPTSNFLGHYALRPLAELGVASVGVTTRYLGNDSALLVENCLLDVGAVVRTIRSLGYDRVVLVGNSGGGGLAALYQAEAEQPSIKSTPSGDGPDITIAELPQVDVVSFFMAHPGRATVLTEYLDPAIEDEQLPFRRRRELDMFEPSNGPPYRQDFIERYRAAQVDRNRRITRWVWEQLAALEAQCRRADGRKGAFVRPDDLPFVVHGTAADPRFLDLSLDPSDREPGTLWGPSWVANYMPATLAHTCSLRSWLSQWSIDHSRADAVRELSRVSVPVQVIYGTADQAAFPSHAHAIHDASMAKSKELLAITGANHYFSGQPELAHEACEHIVRWCTSC
jgi:pimeloyl-ACP methyl ester carboxylesterase